MKISLFIVASWLLMMSLVGCNQATPAMVEENSLPDTQAEGVLPTSEPTDELPVEPTATNVPIEPVADSVQIKEPTSTPQPAPITDASAQSVEEDKPMTSQPVDEGVEKLVTQAKEDLAQRLNIEPEQIEGVEVQAIAWPDASLGCPQSGMMYAQVVTPGYRIVLNAEDKTYEYHTDTQQRVIYCEAQATRLLIDDQSTESIKQAKEDLARRLGISTDSIDVVATIRQEFPANAFYCRTKKERIARDEAPAIISGETILLSVGERKYEYHASDQTVIFCRQLSE